MNFRFGLQARFLALVSVALLTSVIVLGILLHRQWELRSSILELSSDSTRTLVQDRLHTLCRAGQSSERPQWSLQSHSPHTSRSDISATFEAVIKSGVFLNERQ